MSVSFLSSAALLQTRSFLNLAAVLFPKWISIRHQSVNKHALQTYVVTTIWSSLTTSTTFSSSGSSSDWCPVPSWVGFSRKLCTKFWISPRASVAKKTGEIKTNHYHETLLKKKLHPSFEFVGEFHPVELNLSKPLGLHLKKQSQGLRIYKSSA